jgi:3-hydroxyisobutyrate dehydrogenase-like beta-hydroxyacid dehydrogenase
MGLGMARNLQKFLAQDDHYQSLVYFNRTISRGDPLRELGASPASSPQDLVQNSDIVFISLSDDSALTSTIDSLCDGENKDSLNGKIIVDTTTVHPDTTSQVAEQLSKRGAQFIAGPVFGASPVAAEGKLLWVLAGPDKAIQSIEPFIVGTMGRGIIRAGEKPSQATLLKTAGSVHFSQKPLYNLLRQSQECYHSRHDGTDR